MSNSECNENQNESCCKDKKELPVSEAECCQGNKEDEKSSEGCCKEKKS